LKVFDQTPSPKILNKKGFVLSVTNASIFACPNRAPVPDW